jgi:hypothetical protein
MIKSFQIHFTKIMTLDLIQPIEEILKLNRKTPLNDLDPTCNLQMA